MLCMGKVAVWEFNQYRDPLPFEDTSRYTTRPIRNRFTFEMLRSYLKALGLRPFDEDFYLPPGSEEAILVEKVGATYPTMQEF